MSRDQRNRHRLLEEHDASGFEHFAFGADDYDRDALAALLDDRPRYPQEPFETLRGQPGYLYFPPADVEPRSDLYVDGVYDPHANDVTERTLQREIRTPGSGGSGGGRKAKKPTVAAKATAGTVDEPEVEPDTPRFQPYGLTRGEVLALQRRTGPDDRDVLAYDVLHRVISRIIQERRWPDEKVDLPKAKRKPESFAIYGLKEIEVRILHLHRGFATQTLVIEAHRRYPDFIRKIDGRGVRVLAEAS